MNNENLIKVAIDINGLPDYQKNIDKFNAISSRSMLDVNNVVKSIEQSLSSLKMGVDRYLAQPNPEMRQEINKLKMAVDSKLELLNQDSLHPNPELFNKYTNILNQFMINI